MSLKVVVFALSATLCAAVIPRNNPNAYRPCQLNDINCIRSSFTSGARCMPSGGSPPTVLTTFDQRFDAAAFNASYVDTKLIVKGLERCFISEYYRNRKTGRGVLAVDCPGLNIESDRTMYQHYPAQEDAIFHYYIKGTYPLITFTTQLTTSPMNFCQEYSNAHVHALPTFSIIPYDMPTSKHLTRDLAHENTFEREMFAARANLLARAIINNKLCNFGCN